MFEHQLSKKRIAANYSPSSGDDLAQQGFSNG